MMFCSVSFLYCIGLFYWTIIGCTSILFVLGKAEVWRRQLLVKISGIIVITVFAASVHDFTFEYAREQWYCVVCASCRTTPGGTEQQFCCVVHCSSKRWVLQWFCM